MTAGMLCLAVSLAIFSRLGLDSGFWDIFPGLVVGGFGMGLVMTPMTAAALGSVPSRSRESDRASSTRSARSAGPRDRCHGRDRGLVRRPERRPAGSSSFIDGFQAALRVSAVFALIGAVVAVTTIRKHRHMDAGELAEAAA